MLGPIDPSQVFVFTDIGQILTMQGARAKEGRRLLQEDLSIIENAALVAQGGKILWVGPEKQLPIQFKKGQGRSKIIKMALNCPTVLPGFVECHTHSVFSGHRAEEFEWRLSGTSYQEISSRGGGILSTMRATRKSSLAQLRDSLSIRVNNFLKQGVTTLEVKSGYGLSLKDEVKMLKAVQTLGGSSPIKLISTFLGAHARPPEYPSYREYLEFLAEEVLPVILKKKLSRRVDIFIEKGFFELAEGRKYLQMAKRLGFDLTIHADQLSLSGGTDLAVELGALSADHVIQCELAQIEALARSNVTAVLLPVADLYMKCAYPPARKMVDKGVRIALATDFNPGSSPCQDIMLVGLLSRLNMGLSLPEVLGAYTIGASYALGMQDQVGVLSPGYSADFVCSQLSWQELFYSPGQAVASMIFIGGVLRHQI